MRRRPRVRPPRLAMHVADVLARELAAQPALNLALVVDLDGLTLLVRAVGLDRNPGVAADNAVVQPKHGAQVRVRKHRTRVLAFLRQKTTGLRDAAQRPLPS